MNNSKNAMINYKKGIPTILVSLHNEDDLIIFQSARGCYYVAKNRKF